MAERGPALPDGIRLSRGTRDDTALPCAVCCARLSNGTRPGSGSGDTFPAAAHLGSGRVGTGSPSGDTGADRDRSGPADVLAASGG